MQRKIREEDSGEDAFLLYLTFEMFKKQQYDKATLTYLGEYFCGSTRDMKRLWKVMREYEIPSYKVAERIITQMLSRKIFLMRRKFSKIIICLTQHISG